MILRVHGGGYVQEPIRVLSAKCSIGAAPECTVQIRADNVASLHCLILRGSHGTLVRSWARNTRLNGHEFVEAPLRVGDVLSVGPAQLEVVELGGPVGDHLHWAELFHRIDDLQRQLDETRIVPPAEKTSPPPTAAENASPSTTLGEQALDALRRDNQLLQEQLDELRTEQQRWRNVEATWRKQLDEATAANAELTASLQEAIAARDQLSESLANAETSAAAEAGAAANEAAEAAWNEERAELQQQLDQLQDQLSELREKAEAHREQADQAWESERTAHQEQVESLQRELEQQRSAFVEQQAELETSRETLRQVHEHFEQHASGLETPAMPFAEPQAGDNRSDAPSDQAIQALDNADNMVQQLSAWHDEADPATEVDPAREYLRGLTEEIQREAAAESPTSDDAADHHSEDTPADDTDTPLIDHAPSVETHPLWQSQDDAEDETRHMEERLSQFLLENDESSETDSESYDLSQELTQVADSTVAEQEATFTEELKEELAEEGEPTEDVWDETHRTEDESPVSSDLEPHESMAAELSRYLNESGESETDGHGAREVPSAEPTPFAGSSGEEETEDDDSVFARLQAAGIWRDDHDETDAEFEAAESVATDDSAPYTDEGGESLYPANSDSVEELHAPQDDEETSVLGTTSTSPSSLVDELADGDEELDIDSYMQRLLARQRVADAAPQAAAQPAVESNVTPVEEEPTTITEAEYTPRSSAPERSANLVAMRELANENAHSAIDTFARRNQAEQSNAKLKTAGFLAVLGIASLLFISKFVPVIGVTVGLGCLGAAAILGFRAFTHAAKL